MPLINSVVLVSSSFVAYFAERYLHKGNLWGFRAVWFLTMAMGSYFVYGQYIEWSELTFSLSSGVFGGMFYLLTGFHGLHVITGILDGPDVGAFVCSRELRQRRDGRCCGEPVLALR